MTPKTFDPENPKYQCCFGKLDVKTATEWIIYFNFLLSLFFGGYLVILDFDFSWNSVFVLLSAISIDVFLFGTGLYAIKKEKPKWLIPYIIIFILFTIFDVYVVGNDLIHKTYEDAWILYDIFDIAFNVWSIPIFCKCYQYLKDKKQCSTLPMTYTNNNINSILLALEEDI